MAKKKITGLSKVSKLSHDLADFMGKDKAKRTDVIKALWAYIKKNDLQDPDEKRMILPDDVLSPILGKKPINMLKMGSAISKHIIKD